MKWGEMMKITCDNSSHNIGQRESDISWQKGPAVSPGLIRIIIGSGPLIFSSFPPSVHPNNKSWRVMIGFPFTCIPCRPFIPPSSSISFLSPFLPHIMMLLNSRCILSCFGQNRWSSFDGNHPPDWNRTWFASSPSFLHIIISRRRFILFAFTRMFVSRHAK